jgi:hypothetical protein
VKEKEEGRKEREKNHREKKKREILFDTTPRLNSERAL